MSYLSLEPFIPSGNDFQRSKELFLELEFELTWEMDDLAGFKSGDCRFILQKYDNKEFAENLMISVHVKDIQSFWNKMSAKNLPERFGIPALREPVQQPYGKEVNLIDIAGVCWHFIES